MKTIALIILAISTLISAKSQTNLASTNPPYTISNAVTKIKVQEALNTLSNRQFQLNVRLAKVYADASSAQNAITLQEQAGKFGMDQSDLLRHQSSEFYSPITKNLLHQISEIKLQEFQIRQRYKLLLIESSTNIAAPKIKPSASAPKTP